MSKKKKKTQEEDYEEEGEDFEEEPEDEEEKEQYFVGQIATATENVIVHRKTKDQYDIQQALVKILNKLESLEKQLV